MEIKNIHEDVGWYTSYETSQQCKALILCQKLKLKQLSDVIDIIKGEIELCENPQEFSHAQIIESIKYTTENIPTVSYTEGYFKWEG